MTADDALKLLDGAVSQMQLRRQEHASLSEAVRTLHAAITPKPKKKRQPKPEGEGALDQPTDN